MADQIPDDVYVNDDGSPDVAWVPYGDEQEALRHAAAVLDPEDGEQITAERAHLRLATPEECDLHNWEPPAVMQCSADVPGAQECWRVEVSDG